MADLRHTDKQAMQITRWLVVVGPLTTHSSGNRCSTPVPVILSQQTQRAYTAALQLGALNDVGGRPHLSSRHLPFASVTHFLNGLLLIYRPGKDERLSWPRWLTHSGQFTHKLVTCPTISQAQDRESSPVEDQRATTVLRRQQQTNRQNFI